MDPRLIYIIMGVVLAGDAMAFLIIKRQRASLDLQTEAGRKKDQGLKIALMMLPMQAILIVGVLWAVFQPPLILPN